MSFSPGSNLDPSDPKVAARSEDHTLAPADLQQVQSGAWLTLHDLEDALDGLYCKYEPTSKAPQLQSGIWQPRQQDPQ